MERHHSYATTTTWTEGRAHETVAAGRPVLLSSSDPAFRGDASRWNPELLLVSALSQCHLLWYLHLCADAGVVVTGYVDAAEGTMVEGADGGGRFEEVVLRPAVTVAEAAIVDRALSLHERAHELCFIARSVNFHVRHEPTVVAP